MGFRCGIPSVGDGLVTDLVLRRRQRRLCERHLRLEKRIHFDLGFDVEGLLEGLGGEVVDEGVKAAVEGGDAQGDGVHGPGKPLQGAVGDGLGAHERVQEQDGVVGDEAHDENGHVHDDHLQHFLLVRPNLGQGGRLPQSPENQRGAGEVEQQGDDESHHLDEYGDLGQVGFPDPFGEPFEAGGAGVGHVGGGEERGRDSTAEDQDPNASTDDGRVPPGADGAGAEGVHDGQEAIHADAGEEQHAPVDVGEERRARDLAQAVPEGPVPVEVVKNLEGQGEDEKQVRHRQVGHENGRLAPHLHPEEEDEEGGAVCDQAKDEDHAVHGSVQVVLEGIVCQAGMVVAVVSHAKSGMGFQRPSKSTSVTSIK